MPDSVQIGFAFRFVARLRCSLPDAFASTKKFQELRVAIGVRQGISGFEERLSLVKCNVADPQVMLEKRRFSSS